MSPPAAIRQLLLDAPSSTWVLVLTTASSRVFSANFPLDCRDNFQVALALMSLLLTTCQIRLPLQAAAHRRLRCRQVLLAPAFRRRYVHRILHFHHRRGLRMLLPWKRLQPAQQPQKTDSGQKIRTIELDGKTVKLQIVRSFSQPPFRRREGCKKEK
jgi:hypothetical protein